MEPVAPESRHGGDNHGVVADIGGFDFQLPNVDIATRMEASTPALRLGAQAAIQQMPKLAAASWDGNKLDCKLVAGTRLGSCINIGRASQSQHGTHAGLESWRGGHWHTTNLKKSPTGGVALARDVSRLGWRDGGAAPARPSG